MVISSCPFPEATAFALESTSFVCLFKSCPRRSAGDSPGRNANLCPNPPPLPPNLHQLFIACPAPSQHNPAVLFIRLLSGSPNEVSSPWVEGTFPILSLHLPQHLLQRVVQRAELWGQAGQRALPGWTMQTATLSVHFFILNSHFVRMSGGAFIHLGAQLCQFSPFSLAPVCLRGLRESYIHQPQHWGSRLSLLAMVLCWNGTN